MKTELPFLSAFQQRTKQPFVKFIKFSKPRQIYVRTIYCSILTVLISISTMLIVLLTNRAEAQNVAINNSGAAANPKAMLDISSTTGGLLMPRMTTAQRDALAATTTENSLLIFNTDNNCFQAYVNGQWQNIFCDLGCSAAPATPGSITGNTAPCQNATGISYSIAQVAGATSYTWSVPSGATITAGQGTTGIVVTFATTNGNITVTASNNCGTSAAQTLAVNLSAVPAQPSVITLGTGTTICSGVGQTYTVTNVAGTTYTWTYSGTGWSQTAGGTTNSITASATGSGTVTVTPSNTCGNGTTRTLDITVNTAPAAPTAATHTPSATQIVWDWNNSAGATGYKYNTVNDYSTATDNGASSTYTQTGLTCNTAYTLYVWAYNSCGNSSVTTLNQTTSFCCGSSLSISHTAGSVAPETKSVTYGTGTSSISGASKCWITQNLGSTNQASSATDNTDASAGWYWQFNRKQGYKVGPTPSWTITSISEASDWLAANDPCTIELGTGWRIPTYTEWLNADGAPQNWANYTDAYNSVLKLHAAGTLSSASGALGSRGTTGIYWSSIRNNDTSGWRLYIESGLSLVGNSDKAIGATLRCIKD